MMHARSRLEWALGLHAYPTSIPPPRTFADFYSITTRFLGALGMAPSHIAAEGSGYSGKLVKFGGAVTRRLVESGFAGISVLSLAVCPKDSKEPAFDRLINASLAWNLPNELLLCLVANDDLVPFQGAEFNEALKMFLISRKWDFGFALRDAVERQPDFHVLSLDNGRLSKDEGRALARWYATGAAERQARLRSVYPVNILNKRQLARTVGTQTLEEFIRSRVSARVAEVGNLVIWTAAESEIETLRAELGAQGALITVC